mmetsp:Transcript_5951/g.8060  ORF Transcript_5951/g.8060 Transcript_5951/m.8060 type:complete len:101 (-) Transcript_5951:124-426(-)
MSTAYAIVALNALLMFGAVWKHQARVASIYCSMLTCFLQFVLLVAAAFMLLNKYSMVCMLSTTNTYDGFRWTMHDDFSVMIALWSLSWFFLVLFTLFGLS